VGSNDSSDSEVCPKGSDLALWLGSLEYAKPLTFGDDHATSQIHTLHRYGPPVRGAR